MLNMISLLILAVCLLTQGCYIPKQERYVCSSGYETPWRSKFNIGITYSGLIQYIGDGKIISYKIKSGETCVEESK